MEVLKTIFGTDIPIETRGIVYLCEYNYQDFSLKVFREILCNSAFEAFELYANIPNPESQIAFGKTFDEFIAELNILHKNMKDKKWLKELSDYL